MEDPKTPQPTCTCAMDGEMPHGHLYDCPVEVRARQVREEAVQARCEPKTRNSVVLLKDGSVARRNTHHLTRNERTGAPPWTHYPTQPLNPSLAGLATDPGQCVHWSTLNFQGIERVLYVAPGPTFFDPPTGRQEQQQ